MWSFNETVRAGNSTARIKNYYPDTGLIVLMDVEGSFEPGMTIIGDESGESVVLNEFVISRDYDLYYDPTHWENVTENVIFDGNGEMVAQDNYFTGGLNQDYQTTYLVVQG